MTRDDSIKLARAVGFRIDMIDGTAEVMEGGGLYRQTEQVLALINLVERRERAKIGEWVAEACNGLDAGSIALAIFDEGYRRDDYFGKTPK